MYMLFLEIEDGLISGFYSKNGFQPYIIDPSMNFNRKGRGRGVSRRALET